MSSMEMPPWERLKAKDFRDQLRELARDGNRRTFHPLDAGGYVVSVQASGEHASLPRAPAPATEVEAWEVAIFTGDGLLLDESRDPELITLPPEWLRYWRGGVGRFVPTPVLRVLIDRLAFGPEHFDRFVLDSYE